MVTVYSIEIVIYLILHKHVSPLPSAFIYVAFRTPNPDEETLDIVKKALQENGLDFNQLVKWDTNHC
jgi:hypothetical protein